MILQESLPSVGPHCLTTETNRLTLQNAEGIKSLSWETGMSSGSLTTYFFDVLGESVLQHRKKTIMLLPNLLLRSLDIQIGCIQSCFMQAQVFPPCKTTHQFPLSPLIASTYALFTSFKYSPRPSKWHSRQMQQFEVAGQPTCFHSQLALTKIWPSFS